MNKIILNSNWNNFYKGINHVEWMIWWLSLDLTVWIFLYTFLQTYAINAVVCGSGQCSALFSIKINQKNETALLEKYPSSEKDLRKHY